VPWASVPVPGVCSPTINRAKDALTATFDPDLKEHLPSGFSSRLSSVIPSDPVKSKEKREEMSKIRQVERDRTLVEPAF
jgi:hypothetical protein